MKRFFKLLLLSAVAISFAVSCSKDNDSDNDSNVTTKPSGYVKSIDNMVFTYDSKKRVKYINWSEIEALDGGGTVSYVGEMTYVYETNRIDISTIVKIITTTYVDDPSNDGSQMLSTTTSYVSAYDVVDLDDDGVLLKTYENDGYIIEQTYESIGGKVISCVRRDNGSETINHSSIMGWMNDNMVVAGDDVFTYSTTANDCNLDLNMYLTNSEELSGDLLSYSVGFNREVKGIHSANMIATCYEENCLYDVIYTTNTDGQIIEAKWDKYGDGEYNSVSISYY